jgi:serpin B
MQQIQSVQHGSTKIANSIWYRKDSSLKVERSFLQDNAAYYNAGAFQLDFKSQDTVNKMNNWVKRNTDGRIDKILDKIQPNDMMYLINALSFECGWDTPYKSSHIQDRRFNTQSGTVSAKLLVGTAAYLHDSTAEGFVKNFQDSRFGFLAILPNDIHASLSNYISSMTGEKYLSFLKSKNDSCTAYLPMFKYDYSVNLKQQLIKLGLSESFSDKCADFGRMGTYEGGNLYIGEVLHKTNIEVSPTGVKAGAAVQEVILTSGADGLPKQVILDRPFIYAIIDNASGLPIFLGTVENPEAN